MAADVSGVGNPHCASDGWQGPACLLMQCMTNAVCVQHSSGHPAMAHGGPMWHRMHPHEWHLRNPRPSRHVPRDKHTNARTASLPPCTGRRALRMPMRMQQRDRHASRAAAHIMAGCATSARLARLLARTCPRNHTLSRRPAAWPFFHFSTRGACMVSYALAGHGQRLPDRVARHLAHRGQPVGDPPQRRQVHRQLRRQGGAQDGRRQGDHRVVALREGESQPVPLRACKACRRVSVAPACGCDQRTAARRTATHAAFFCTKAF